MTSRHPDDSRHALANQPSRSTQGSPPIAVLGAGNWGTVIALLASKRSREVYLYDRDKTRTTALKHSRINEQYLPNIKLPPNILPTNDLSEPFEKCRLVFVVVPSASFRVFTQSFAKYTTGEHFLVHGTKGLEPLTFVRMSQILSEETNSLRVGALSGPNLANELAEGLIGATVISSRFDEVISSVQCCLSSNQFHVYGNHDLVGVEWAGALKNILAVAAGLMTATGSGNNATAMILTRAIAEISLLMGAVGAHSSTLLGLAGIGDIFATCTSPQSRNFRAGEFLAHGKTIEEIKNMVGLTAEGLNTISVAHQICLQKRLLNPIIATLYRIAYERYDVRRALSDLMGSHSTYEFSFQ